MPIEINFRRGYTGGADLTVTKVKTGQWIPDADRVAAETRLSRNALARILSALAGPLRTPARGQQLFSSGKVDIDPRVYLIELSNNFLEIGTMFDPHGVNEPDHLRIVNQVVRGYLDVPMKVLAAKPDKDLESRAKKMHADCDKALKKLAS